MPKQDGFHGTATLDKLFDPTFIAVFGASASGHGVGSQVFANLLNGGFEGPVVPINPKHQTVRGKTCYPTLKAADQDIELAVIATPAARIRPVRTILAFRPSCRWATWPISALAT